MLSGKKTRQHEFRGICSFVSSACAFKASCVCYLSRLGNWELPCGHILGELLNHWVKICSLSNMHDKKKSKQIAYEICFYWYLLVGLFATCQNHSFSPLLFLWAPCSQPWCKGTQEGNHGTGGFCIADPNQHWLQLKHHVSISGKWEFSPFFSLHFCNLIEANSSRSQCPYQSDICTKPSLKGLLLQCYLINRRLFHSWTASSYIILQQSKTSPLEKDAAQILFTCVSEHNTNTFV